MSVTNDEKNALVDLNQRFLCYVNKVRRLKDEEDIRIINENVSVLEDELRALKGSYETQISQLSTTLDIVVTQKLDMERELMSRKNNEVLLSDRLAVEGARNTRLLHEISGLRSDVSVKEQEIISLNLALQQVRLESGDSVNQRMKLQRDLESSHSKNGRYEAQILEYENNMSSLTQKIDFQDHFFTKKLDDMKEKLEDYLQKMVDMDYRVEDAKQRESQWPYILERVHKTASEEYNKFKTEAEAYVNERISHIQRQLDIEVSENNTLKQINEDLNQKWLQLRKTDIELRSKVEQLQQQSNILEDALKKDKNDSEKTIMSLQKKIKQLQDNFMQELEDVKTGRGLSDVQIKGEIEFLKRLLTEEEKRLNIRPGDQQLEEVNNSEQVLNKNQEEISDDDICDGTKNRYMNNTSTEECLQYESEGWHHNNYPQRNGHLKFMDDVNTTNDANIQDNSYQWSDLPAGDAVHKSSSFVGPVCYPEHVVGPVRAMSSIPHPPNERPPRPASANVRGIRSKTVSSQQEFTANQNCSSRSSNQRADSGLGQSPDYFDSVMRKKDKEAENINGDDKTVNLTNVKVMEVNKDGKYIRICNNSNNQDVEIGNYMIKQNRFSHPVAMFRFPDRVKLPANATVTIWSGSNDPLLHQPPTDFFSPEPSMWGSGPEYTTILCNSLGQAVSWTTQPHRIHPDAYRARTAPSNHKENKRDSSKKLPELIPSNGLTVTEQAFLIRENDNSMCHAIHHPFTSTPKSSIHPCIEPCRGKIIGNDNSSFNRQTRQPNDGIPDPMTNQPYTGNNAQRMIGSAHVMRYYPGSVQSSHSINNRAPDVIFRSPAEPPNTFQKPLSRFMSGLDQVQSMHNHFYNPPMYKTEADATAN